MDRRCGGCGATPDGTPEGRVTEHEHSTGQAKYRAALCVRCAQRIVGPLLACAVWHGRGHITDLAELIESLPVTGEKAMIRESGS